MSGKERPEVGDYAEVCSPIDGVTWRGEGRIAEIRGTLARIGEHWFPLRNVRVPDCRDAAKEKE